MIARRFVACCLAAGAVATIGGTLFDLLHSGTTLAVSVAYALWVGAALALLAMAVGGSKRLVRRFGLPLVESWLFAAGSGVLIAVGAAVDVLFS